MTDNRSIIVKVITKVKVIAALILISILIMVACKKEPPPPNITPVINVPDTVSAGKAVPLSIQNISYNTIVRWSLSTPTGFYLDSLYSYGNNTITFRQPGSYQINFVLNQLASRPDSIPQPPHSDSLWLPTDSTYFRPLIPTTDSAWYQTHGANFHILDSTFYFTGDTVRFTRTIIVNG
ncbi:MAG TPA: hypothetical protein VNS32_07690 [Flavisolibacter sp.]|nr:hypothetical protein [Flavisolibacter sp.]